jgi:hypothetical protein
MTKNVAAKELAKPIYRHKVVPNKKKDVKRFHWREAVR